MKLKQSTALAIASLLLAGSCTLVPSPVQQPTAMPARDTPVPTPFHTSTPVATYTEPPATATPTHTSIPTDTPVPTHTASSTPIPSPTTPPPTATSTPILEPVTFRIRGLAPRYENVEAHQPVVVEWAWGVCNPDVVSKSVNAISFEVSIDGSVAATGDLAEQRSAVREEDWEGIHVWVTYWSQPMGAFASGSFHWIEVEWHLTAEVTDGCDSDGDGHLDVYGPGTLGVQRLEVTVR
jgi:hypothetical protein